ncbi:MAG: hypothetical protein SWO11_07795 [Thermodesulfobacteriota bacterium]|nr:hypothetical protein [Thermodesulfobacteriota bacterium]
MPRKRGREWDIIRDAMLGASEAVRSVEERETVPDKACGKCKDFFQAGLGTTSGMCNVLKEGSNIQSDPPVFVTEGEGFIAVSFNTDASKCKYYNEMEMIDTDISQAHDPKVSRHQRQMLKE